VENQPLISNLDAVKNSCLPKRTVLFDPDAMIKGKEPRDADASARQLLEKAAQAFLVDVQAARNNSVWPLPIADPPRARPIPPSVVEEPLIMDYPEGVPDELAEEIARGRVVVLLGDALDPEAAVSSREFARAMSDEAGLDEPDLLLAGSMIEKKSGRDTLAKSAMQLLNSKGYKPTAPYLSFAQLPIQTVVSFYPDPVLEHLLLKQDPPFQLLIEDDDLAEFKTGQGNRVLYLLGGSALTGRGLVLTDTDHNRLLKRIEVLARGLRDRLALQTLLLIGVDMGDLNLKELYFEATKHLGNSRTRPIYVVSAANPGKWFSPCCILDQTPMELFEALSQVVPLPQPTIKPPVSPQTQIGKKRSPYKYLDYFESEDADLFFGREEEWSHISREIMASPSRVTVLCGRSGVGKTSLVKARLIPRLEQDKDIITTYTRFGKDPEISIFNALQTHIIKEGIKEKIPPGDIKAALRILFHKCHREHVIFLDQTEEAFIKLGKALLDSFFRSIRECVSGTNTGTYVVFVIREDYLGWLAKHRDQFPGLLSSVCLLQEFTHESAREAIVKPAEICGLQVEDTLVEEVLDDLSPDSILPAQLQIVCDRIYRESNKKVLTLETYTKIGRAARILKVHLEDAMSRLPVESESTARKVLQALVTSEHTKDLLSLEQIVKRTQLPMKKVEAAVHDLIHAQRLIREVPGDPVRFELSHESLAVSVSEWFEEKELRVREVQEILDQEVSNDRKFKEFQFPLDKLRLIDQYREYLDLDKDSINVVIKTFLKYGQLPKFWMIKGVLCGSEYYINVGIKQIFEERLENELTSIFLSLIEVSVEQSELILKSCKIYADKSQHSMVLLNTIMDNPIVSANLANEVLLGGLNLLEIIIEIIFMGSSGDTLEAIISGFGEIPDNRTELILKTFKTLAGQSKSFLDILRLAVTKKSISEMLVKSVFFRSESISEIIIEIIFKVSSGETLAAIISGLGEIPEKRAELILKTCMICGENQRPLLLMALEKQELDALLLNRIMKCDLHHWPSVLRYLFERLGMEMAKILLLRDEPKIVRIILKFLKGNISGGLKWTCIEFIKNVNGPHALTELLKALKSKNNRTEIVRNAILDALEKNIKRVANSHPEIVDMIIRSIIHFVGDELVRLHRIIRSCFPKVRSVVEAAVDNNDDNPKIQEFARLILQEYDNSENLKSDV
jgi:hypothetical protein